MKILIFAVSWFLAISILNAGDTEKIINESSSTTKNDNAKVEIIKSSTTLLGKSNSLAPNKVDGKIILSSDTLKSKPKVEEKKKLEIFTIAELRKKQNMEIVELKKKQNKEIKAFEEVSKARIKLKSAHRNVMKDLKLRHRAEQMEFKKAHPLKKGEVKKKGSKINQNKKEK